MPIKVTERHGEPGEWFLKRFKRICVKSGLFRELKKRRFFEKPSDKRRREQKEAVRQAKRAERLKLRRGTRSRR